ncbi:MAG: GNAT family N-acetyltransferase [Pseudomonadota bacterium]|uniref:GNAT family N-acetyltransferase n=1 Tax=Polaromonas sp. TaxID=1869339 RepID=UPI0017E7CCAA|nr:GNAT family N-acetyltransferase [Polaromonas sp.]MBA3594542.1 GNAT family N-acetyltransferase [Polaromonas sp.]MDQ3270773.1 GNAT family N-acetyltransferase [Pseudomonadota bacterium]
MQTTTHIAPITINPLQASDYAAWQRLGQGYNTFYERELPQATYDRTWQRLLNGDGIHGFAARVDGQLVGITHYLFQASIWSADVCYLQDLFVDEAARGHGVAQALIKQVAEVAKARGAPKLYWLTHTTNARARRLYDRVAKHHGFIRYDYALS